MIFVEMDIGRLVVLIFQNQLEFKGPFSFKHKTSLITRNVWESNVIFIYLLHAVTGQYILHLFGIA